jgi:alkyl hydroperoxide reductase subunit F
MLDANLKAQLKSYLERVTQPIEIVASLDDGAKSREMLDLLKDVASLSSQITLLDNGDDARKPSFSINRPGADISLRFAGIPMGHEFTSLVLALLQVGGHPSKASAEVIEQIRSLKGEFNFETYFSLSCQNCPDVVQALNLMAVLNPNIRHVAIDGALFQDEVDERQIMAVPSIYLNGVNFGQGRMGLEEILAKLDTSGIERQAEKISAKEAFDVLVVGGGPAGARRPSTQRAKAFVPVWRRSASAARCWTPWPSKTSSRCRKPKGRNWRRGRARQAVRRRHHEPAARRQADPGKDGELHEVHFASGAKLKAKTVILATGARWREMNVPGEQEYRNKGVAYCPHCDGPLFKGKRVAVIGGGNSGVEAAIDLAGIVSHVTLLEFDVQLRADAVLQRKLHSLPNVTVITMRKPLKSPATAESQRPALQGSQDRRAAHRRAGRHLRADRSAAEHRLAQRHHRAVAAWRDHRRCPWRDLDPGHLRRR